MIYVEEDDTKRDLKSLIRRVKKTPDPRENVGVVALSGLVNFSIQRDVVERTARSEQNSSLNHDLIEMPRKNHICPPIGLLGCAFGVRSWIRQGKNNRTIVLIGHFTHNLLAKSTPNS